MSDQPANPWWKETTIYQIYPRSFQDSNGDGIGDLPGIISRLDYIKDLGFETVWLSPFFASPQQDHGYDISDYTAIAPEYGSMADCERLIAEAHKRGLRLIFDMVMNHTSDRHPWFLESAASRDNPKRDWYIWRDGKSAGRPPNNWLSQVRGSGWQYHQATGQWYWAAFLPFQPDLNYRNPAVKAAMFDILRFWLDKGVDGFRLDIIGAIYEDAAFRDNPRSSRLLPGPDSNDKFFQSVCMTQNLPETILFAKELRALVDEYPERFLIGETFGSMADLRAFTGNERPDGLHAAFVFKSLTTAMRAKALRKLIEEQERYFPEPWTPTWVMANHDSMRRLTWYNGDERLLRLQVLLQHTARGIPVTYQGEEIAMRQADIPQRGAQDPVARLYGFLPAPLFRLANRLNHGAMNRDGCRTPMQWSAEANGGFSTPGANTWLPVQADRLAHNVADQQADPESLLSLYRRLLTLRAREDCLRSGSLTLPAELNSASLLAYERRTSQDCLLVVMNLSTKARALPAVRTGGLVLSTASSAVAAMDPAVLSPYEGRIYRRS